MWAKYAHWIPMVSPLERFFEKLCFLDSRGDALQAGEVPVFYCLADSMPVYLKQLLSENSF